MQSLWTADLSEADVVCVYGVPPMLDALEDKLVRELPAGAHVLSNLFEMPMAMQQTTVASEASDSLPPARHLTCLGSQWVNVGRLSLDDSGHMWLYRVDSAMPMAACGDDRTQHDN